MGIGTFIRGKTLWIGIVGLAALVCFAPCSKAQQEVNPDHFTATGVEGVWSVTGAAVQKEVRPARRATQSKSKQPLVRRVGHTVAHRRRTEPAP